MQISWKGCIGLLLMAGAVLHNLQVEAASCFPAPDGLIGWWPGDGNALTVVGTNNGTLQGGATTSNPGLVGNTFTFDGTNNFVQIADAAVLHPTNFTVEAWIRFTGLDSAGSGGSPAGDQYIFFKQNTRNADFEGIDLSKTRIAGSDRFRFQVTSATEQIAEMESATVISTGVWYHVAAVRAPTTIQLYVNGVLERQTNVAFAQSYGTLPLFFGTSGQNFWDHKFRGNLDEVSFYNRPLSSNEIAAIFLAGNAGKCKAANIATQPQNLTLGIGATAQFTVTATGIAPLSYQWTFNGVNLAGATTSSLTLTNIQLGNGGNYTVVVSNFLGSATSSVAVLTVLLPPNITSQPVSRTNVAGTDASFSVVASGIPTPAYQWQFNSSNIEGATGSSLTLGNVQPSVGGNYAVVITNVAGATNSSVAVLTVWVPPAITTQPLSRTNITGSDATFSVVASGTPNVSYQWQFGGVAIPGATSSSLTISSVQLSSAGNYAVVVSNSAGSLASAVATLTVWAPPAITVQPVSTTNLAGTSASFSVNATGTAPLSYQWQFNSVNIDGATESNLALNDVQPGVAGNYTVVVTNVGGALTSAVATLTVWVPPSISTAPNSQTVIAGSDVAFTVVAAGTLPLSYQWLADGIPLSNGGNISGATTAILTITAVQPNNAAAYTVVVTNVAGSVTTSPAAVLTVNVPPTLTVAPQSQTVIAGSNVTMNVSASGTLPLNYQWQLFGTNLVNGGNISGATAPNLTIFAAQMNNAGPYTVVITNVAASLTSSPPAQLMVNVPPSITAQPQSLTVLVGSNVTFTVGATGTAPLSYQWRANGVNLIEGPSFIGTTTPTLGIPNAQQIHSAAYSVLVSNVAASVLSSAANLIVINPDVVVFCDTNLEDAVRLQLGKPGGEITRLDLLNLNVLCAPDSHITCLAGLEWATNLTALYLNGNLISDLSILTNFARLTNLFLAHNLLVDLSPLATLTNLTKLDVRRNPTISKFSAIAGPPNLSEAYLGGNLFNNFGFLPGLSQLTLLSFDSNPVTNLTSLAALPNLKSLDLSYNPALKFQDLAAFGGLTDLYLSGSGITNLSFAQSLVQLTNFSVAGNSITNLSPLTALSNLRALNLVGNPDVSDFSSLSSLINLESLSLNSSAITNVDFLQTLTRLNVLNLDNNGISNISSVAGLTNLNILSVAQNLLPASAALSNLTNLLSVNLAQNSIINPILPQVPNRLKSLNLSSNSITSVQSLTSLTSLESLDLSANPIVDYAEFTSFSNLSTLSLHGNSIGDISFIQNLQTLSSLDLRDNLISDLSPLSGLTNLSELNLAKNLIANPATLASLGQLEFLDLSTNPVSDWSPLGALTNLTELYLQNDSLSDLSFLPSARLMSLDISLNRFSNSAPLGVFKNLHYLFAGNNRFKDISDLSALPRLWYTDLRTNLLDITPGSIPMTVIEALSSRKVAVDYIPQNQPPVVSLPGIWPIPANTTSATLGFDVFDDVTVSNLLTVTSVSSNVALIPDANIQLEITTSNRTLTVTPITGQVGNTLITLTVTDETALSTMASVLVTVATQQNVSVPDTNLRASVRSATGKPSGALNNIDLLKLSQLTANFANIGDLTGLEWASNLVSISLAGNSVSNISRLQNLPALRTLTLDYNPIRDFSQVATLTNLTELSLVGDSVTNFSFVTNLTSLSLLNLNNNLIADLSPVTALTNLNYLYLGQNAFSDISPLLSQTHLTDADVTLNLLDTSPGSPPMAVISTLQSYSTVVFYLPQRSGPGISAPTNWRIPVNAPSYLTFNVLNSSPPAISLTVTAASSNESLLPGTNVSVFQNADQSWTLKATPLNQSGDVTVTLSVTDNLGLAGSQPVAVNVVIPGFVGNQFLNNLNLDWITWGNAQWFGETAITHDGISAAQSGHINDNQDSWLGTSVIGPGRLSYWWRVSSETNFDFLQFYINGDLQANRLSGEKDWQQQISNVPVGTNVLRWRYVKDQNTSRGADAGWLDEVNYSPGVWLELVGPPVGGQTQLILHGIPGNPYEVQVSTNLVNWSRLLLITPTSADTSVFDNAAGNGNRFYRLHDLSLGLIYFEMPTVTANSIRLVLHSPANLSFVVLTSTNLKDWTALTTVTNTLGTVQLTNSLSLNSARRYYRAQLAP